MRLIDVVRGWHASFPSRGLRAAAWKLDRAAIAQLRREASEEGMDVVSISSPATFLGVPIEEVTMSGAAQADYVFAHRRLVSCRRPDRAHDRQWDVFNLDSGEAFGAFYSSKDEADRAALQAELEA